MKPLEIRRASIHEVVVLAATALAVAIILIEPAAASRGVAQTLPGWAGPAYYVGVLLGAGTALFGAGWFAVAHRGYGQLDDALQVERAGLLVAGPLQLAYAVALVSLGTLTATFPALTSVAVGVAHLHRTLQITHDLDRYRRAVSDPTPADPPPLADPGPEK